MKHTAGLAALTLLLALSSSDAQVVVKQEPLEGQMVPGGIVLVDDGTCGKGKIKEVTGGENRSDEPQTPHSKMHFKGQKMKDRMGKRPPTEAALHRKEQDA